MTRKSCAVGMRAMQYWGFAVTHSVNGHSVTLFLIHQIMAPNDIHFLFWIMMLDILKRQISLLLIFLIKFITWFWLLFCLRVASSLSSCLWCVFDWLHLFIHLSAYLFIYFFNIFVQFCIPELPPPPINVQSADVRQTEAVVTWSHPEFYDMYSISSYSLQVRKFGTKNWTQFTTTRGENLRLTNLHPDTAYSVRLKSENKYGKGEPSETGELRTEKGILFPFLLLGPCV